MNLSPSERYHETWKVLRDTERSKDLGTMEKEFRNDRRSTSRIEGVGEILLLGGGGTALTEVLQIPVRERWVFDSEKKDWFLLKRSRSTTRVRKRIRGGTE